MDVKLMRSEISKVYLGNRWKTKVRQMPNDQVIAIYYSFLKNDRFKTQKKKENKEPEYRQQYQQLSFDDYIYGYDESSERDKAALRVYGGKSATCAYYDEE